MSRRRSHDASNTVSRADEYARAETTPLNVKRKDGSPSRRVWLDGSKRAAPSVASDAARLRVASRLSQVTSPIVQLKGGARSSACNLKTLLVEETVSSVSSSASRDSSSWSTRSVAFRLGTVAIAVSSSHVAFSTRISDCSTRAISSAHALSNNDRSVCCFSVPFFVVRLDGNTTLHSNACSASRRTTFANAFPSRFSAGGKEVKGLPTEDRSTRRRDVLLLSSAERWSRNCSTFGSFVSFSNVRGEEVSNAAASAASTTALANAVDADRHACSAANAYAPTTSRPPGSMRVTCVACSTIESTSM
mmetsp:Transcript_4058/g.17210  ORF Transcript_4058/g.17210 Transcript_4058/m.17210 type:complete len:305 (+) Transcript_4058:787-1701(+)